MNFGIQLLAYLPILAVCIAAIVLVSLNLRVATLPSLLVLFGVVMLVAPTVVLTLAQYYLIRMQQYQFIAALGLLSGCMRAASLGCFVAAAFIDRKGLVLPFVTRPQSEYHKAGP